MPSQQEKILTMGEMEKLLVLTLYFLLLYVYVVYSPKSQKKGGEDGDIFCGRQTVEKWVKIVNRGHKCQEQNFYGAQKINHERGFHKYY